MRAALVAHDEMLRTAIEAHDGFLFSHTGDGVVVDPPGRNAAAGAVEPVHQATRTDRPLRGDDAVVGGAHHRDQPQTTSSGVRVIAPYLLRCTDVMRSRRENSRVVVR